MEDALRENKRKREFCTSFERSSPCDGETGSVMDEYFSDYDELEKKASSPLHTPRRRMVTCARTIHTSPRLRPLHISIEAVRRGIVLWTGDRSRVETAFIDQLGDCVIKFLKTDEDALRAMADDELGHLLHVGLHPNVATLLGTVVVPLLDVGEQSHASLGIVFERAIGSLVEMPDHLYDIAKVVTIGLHISKALAHLHERHVVHNDVKPANILAFADKSGRPTFKLADFGVSTVLMGHQYLSTREHGQGGTMAFMAPEKFDQSNQYGTAADVYSFGVTLERCLARCNNSVRPEGVGETIEIRSALSSPVISQDHFGPLSPILLELKRFISSCMNEDPAHRPTGTQAFEFFTALGHAMSL